jgi:hypothetical protein
MASSARSHSLEREALARLLTSGYLERSPNLERILVYLCTKYFDGESGEVKEYHIATEVLGRPPDFDPKQSSIVRVEMHRLRRRLREYYDSNPGADIELVLPEKSYIPEFRRREAKALAPVEDSGAYPLSLPAVRDPSDAEGARRTWLKPLAASGAALVALAVFLGWPRETAVSPPPLPRAPAAVPAPVTTAAAGDVVRILAGRPSGRYLDRNGRSWQGDEIFAKGGVPVPVTQDVFTGGFDRNLFTAMREGEFELHIPLKARTHEMLLLFAETMYGEGNPLGGGEAYRVFNVFANGKRLLADYDPISDARAPNAMTARAFRDITPGPDGKLTLRFSSTGSGKPFVNAVILTPSAAGRINPIRIVCRPDGYRDSKNQFWEPDQFYRGGVQITRPNGAPLPEDGDVFRGERYGSFTYRIPVPPGSYTARLHFWEYWWGRGHPGEGGQASRVFDVFINYNRVLDSFSVIRADPTNQVSVQTFRGLNPNRQGRIEIDFLPSVNYAMLNAIEILDEGI